jgi:hypothetical protein
MAHSKFLVEQLRTLDSRLARSKIDYSKLDIDTSRQCDFQRRCSHEHLRDNLQSRAILENENAEDAHVTQVSTFDGREHLGDTWTKPTFEIILNSPNGTPWRDQYPPNKITIDGDLPNANTFEADVKLQPYSDRRERGYV